MRSARILVVDDEADIRELVQEILTEEGYVVEVAGNAAEARAAPAWPDSEDEEVSLCEEVQRGLRAAEWQGVATLLLL